MIDYKEEFERIQKHLRALDADYSEIEQAEDCIQISVEWGDWKHSHIYLDNAMKQIGFTCWDEIVTEQDGSDCYSSIHVFKRETEQ